MMNKLIASGLISSLFIIHLHLTPVCSGFLGLGGNSVKETECLNNLDGVKNLNHLAEFLTKLEIGLNNKYYTEKEARNCLELENVGKENIGKFKNLIGSAEDGSICSIDNIEKLVAQHTQLSQTNKDNKKSHLSPWWDKFVKQVIIKCKSSFITKLNQNSPDELLIKGIINLASKFRWDEVKNFIKESDDVSNVLNDKSTGQDSIESILVGETSKNVFDELLDAQNLASHIPKDKKQIKLDVQLTEHQFARLDAMFEECTYIGFYKRWAFEPVFKLSELGYNDSALEFDVNFANNKYIHLWQRAFRMCSILDHVKVLSLINGQTRLKAGRYYKLDDMDELGAEKLMKMFDLPLISAEKKTLTYKRNLDSFDELDDELIEKIAEPNNDNSKMRQRKSFDYADNVMKLVYSDRFLEVIADFIKATNDFDHLVKEKTERIQWKLKRR